MKITAFGVQIELKISCITILLVAWQFLYFFIGKESPYCISIRKKRKPNTFCSKAADEKTQSLINTLLDLLFV